MKTIGLIDIGSNNVRLVIYEIHKNKKDFTIALNTKESVRLRSHVVNNELSKIGINKLLDCLHQFKWLLDNKYKVDHLYLFATQTIRMVDNKDQILKTVKNQLHFEIDVLNEEQEASLGFNGMDHYLKHQTHGLYVDLGGGSTEVLHFNQGEIIEFHSFPFGSIVLRSMIDHPIPTKDEMKKIKKFITDYFDTIPWLKDINVPLVVVGGSSRNLVRIDKFITKRHETTHGYKIGFRELHRTRKLLMLLTIDEIQNIEGFTKNRSDVIIPSIYVFETLYKYTNATEYVCSRTGLREGVLIAQMEMI